MTTGIRNVLRFYIKVYRYQVILWDWLIYYKANYKIQGQKNWQCPLIFRKRVKWWTLISPCLFDIFWKSSVLSSYFRLLLVRESTFQWPSVFTVLSLYSIVKCLVHLYFSADVMCKYVSRFFMYVFIATRLAYFAQLHLCSLNIVPLWLNVMNLRPSYKTELVSHLFWKPQAFVPFRHYFRRCNGLS